MPGSWSPEDFPFLTADTCEITSRASRRYNCLAWAAGNDARFWWPDPMGVGYWPQGAPREVSVPAFLHAYETLGYALCFDGALLAESEKVAIFGKETEDGTVIPTHAAIQLESGAWSSKLGTLEDVRHNTVDDVRGPLYGKVICFMSRPRRAD